MHYGEIKKCDIANGPGVRTSLFVSGCRHCCRECFNPQTWDFEYGRAFTKETTKEILDSLRPDYVQGLSLLGGEPFEPENQAALAALLEQVRTAYPDKDIWCYTGYLYDVDLQLNGKVYTEWTERLLKNIDVLVDGEFIIEEKDLTLLFRGSRNQRLIDLRKTRENGAIALYQEQKRI